MEQHHRPDQTNSTTAPANPLIRKLEQRDTLAPEEKQALDKAMARGRIKEFRTKEEMVREHDEPSFSTLLLDGWAARYKSLSDGRRQMLAFHISGDFVDLHAFPLKVQDHSVVALTPCKVVLVPHEALNEITENFPHLTRLLWVSTLIDGAIVREWLLSTGRRSAIEHVANLMCETYTRLQAIGLAKADEFNFPLTQAELGDALGISTVHVNRVLQDLRKEGLITWKGDRIEINDWDRLCALADFDPTYLHLDQRPR
ncbi:Crp/Fnr family transcriptional regulator [Microvirga makkahensis]|uniref:Helix-turn-helix domain-containing protein n=1 Tax=Microvirga makkahensis TaxID=1128670 RepID=A0A7X3MPQ5_9HYPH|nr:Crp/Fnr family transcriptional regulator [Microvirga makkahensis]MXQ10946.1 helix-turn-helix domain-containing protein [Microvirga makkahensis]